MKISMITDEVSADPETAIELGTEWGIHDYELRGFFTERAPRFSSYQKQRLRDALDEFGARIVAIGPGLFKFPYPQAKAPRQPLGWMDWAGYQDWTEAKRQHEFHLNELLPETLDYANELGAHLVIIFSFDRGGAPPGFPPDEILNCLRTAADRASSAGLKLAIENENGFWADSGERTAKVVKMINHPALGINWDPGNAFFAGDTPFPIGYNTVRELVYHVHFKDAFKTPDDTFHYADQGQVDWDGQIRGLAANNYDGFISIETHIRPKVASARSALERLSGLIAATKNRTDDRHE